MKHTLLLCVFVIELTDTWQSVAGQNGLASVLKTVRGQTVTNKNVTDSTLTGYRYNGLDFLLCPSSYTCGELGSPFPPDQKIPYTCCSGFIILLLLLL